MLLLTTLKRSKTNLITRENVKLNQGTFFFLPFFNGYCMIRENVGGIKDPLKQDMALEFGRKKNKDISILTETHINHYQIHHLSLSIFLWLWKILLRLTLIQKRGFCPLRLLPLITEFSVFMPLQVIAAGNSW